nr:MAG TPA: hypothetical protein [Caudoviricetes sp.]
MFNVAEIVNLLMTSLTILLRVKASNTFGPVFPYHLLPVEFSPPIETIS